MLGKFRKDETWQHLASTKRELVIEPKLKSYFGLVQRALTVSGHQAQPQLPKAKVIKTQEKGSDVNLASFLLKDAFEGLKNAVVISGDSDLVTPISFSREMGSNVRVVVPNPHITCSALRQAASSLIQLTHSDLEGFQLPDKYTTNSGRIISRPRAWA